MGVSVVVSSTEVGSTFEVEWGAFVSFSGMSDGADELDPTNSEVQFIP